MHSNFPSQTTKNDNSFFYRWRQLPGRHLVGHKSVHACVCLCVCVGVHTCVNVRVCTSMCVCIITAAISAFQFQSVCRLTKTGIFNISLIIMCWTQLLPTRYTHTPLLPCQCSLPLLRKGFLPLSILYSHANIYCCVLKEMHTLTHTRAHTHTVQRRKAPFPTIYSLAFLSHCVPCSSFTAGFCT
jgi:hypothetical protein